jgi:hypothetical protein
MPEEVAPRKRRRVETEANRQWFEIWYSEERNYERTYPKAGVSRTTIFKAARDFDWSARADARDAELSRLREREAVQRQQALLKKQRQAGELLRLRGMECLQDKDWGKIRDPAKAIKAIQVGIELERQAEDMPEWIFEIRQKTDEELLNERDRLLRLARIEAGRDRDGDEEPEDRGAEEDEGEEE